MKKYLILLMMSVLFACNSQAGYVLKGVFKGAGDGSAILRMHSKGKLVICDTVKMKRGTTVTCGLVTIGLSEFYRKNSFFHFFFREIGRARSTQKSY